ncbi:MAG: GNAT family N-acetyltransferase [Alphaproteobacteria bacterium]|nr:GNAT family N-acetyltransferase [Alphaproteobacteria bacterium]
MIRPAIPEDAAAIVAIYNHYVVHTFISFEEQPVSEQAMRGRMADVQAVFPWLVSETNGLVDGFAYARPWKGRCAYRNSVETTVYVDREKLGRGVGTLLYQPLLQTLKDRGYHTAIGGIALPNDGSVALHEGFGFKKVAHFEEVGLKFGGWVDVGYWQLLF